MLIVDDNATNRLILSEILASWQMRAVPVNGVADALSALREAAGRGEPFHLVLTDALMPDVDGFTLATEIARDEQLATTKVILLTSAGLVRPRGQAGAATFAATLTKPVKQSDLLDAIVTTFAAPTVPPPRRARGARGARPERRFARRTHSACSWRRTTLRIRSSFSLCSGNAATGSSWSGTVVKPWRRAPHNRST